MLMKRLIATTAVSVALAFPISVFAKDTPRNADVSRNSASIQSDKLIHANVRNDRGDKLGEIEGVLLDRKGATQGVIVDVGGFLGVAERRVVLGWDDLRVTDNGDKVTARYTKDQLKALPEYKYPRYRMRETAFYDPAWYAMPMTPVIPTKTAAERKEAKVADRNRSNPDADWHKVSGDIRAKNLIDAKVRNRADEDIGTVDDAIVDRNGKIKALIIDAGGFLGMGSHRIALDFNRLQLSQRNDELRLITGLTKNEIRSLPEYRMMTASAESRSSGGSTRR